MDEFEYKGFKYRIVSVVDATVELIYAGELTGKIVVPEEVEYQNQKCKVVAIRGAKKTEYYDYQPDDKRRKVERRSRYVYFPVFVGRSLQSFQDKLEVVLPRSLKEIGDYAFYRCYNLVSVNIPVGVTSIGNSAFHDCRALSSITIPNSVTSIGDSVFSSCDKLTSVTMGNSVNNIIVCLGEIPSLTSVDVNNPNYCAIDGVMFDKNQTTIIKYPRGKQGASYIIPNNVTRIGNAAFARCDKLTSVTIPNSVTRIEIFAFNECSSLTSVTIPDSVTSIEDKAFSNCDALISVTIENEEGKVAIDKGTFPSRAKITYVGKPKEQPAKPAEKEIAQPKPEAPKATTPTNPGVVIDLEKLMAAALIDGVVTDKERAILIKKVKEAGGDVNEFEMLLDARIHETQQKQAQQQPTKPVEKESQPTPEVRKAEGSFMDRIKNFFKS